LEVEMKLIDVAALVAFIFVAATPARAAELFWLESWNVDLDVNNDVGVGSKRRAFGASAAGDGVITDIDDDAAVARAESHASTLDSGVRATWIAEVEFDRRFQLFGGPNGWNLTLEGLLEGFLSNFVPDDEAARVRIRGGASILDEDGLLVTCQDGLVPLEVDFDARRAGAGIDHVSLAERRTCLVPDGIYMVTGGSSAESTVFSEAITGLRGEGSTRFFGPGLGLIVRVAAEVPEPASVLLLAAGVWGGLIRARRRAGRRT
jgi:hypothetical protein